MTWQPALGLWGWIILGLVPPLIVLLYFLKLRRTPIEVPSTYLWTRTIEDLHVNSIWQRLRNSLLLILQLLLVSLLILAALGPGCQGESLEGDRFIFLVDQSASMSATDVEPGKTRLDIAKEEVGKLIDSMEADDTAMIIAFSDRANVQQSYTKNKSLLKRKLAEIQQTQRSTDITEALTAASGLANPGRTSDRESARDIQVADALAATLFIYSDGAIREVPTFSLGNLTPEYRPVGSLEIPFNVGITAMAISDELDSAGMQVFARLQNSDDEPHTVDAELYVDDELFDAQAGIELPANDARGISFDTSGIASQLEHPVAVRLELTVDDVYSLDNVAYGALRPPRKANVLIVTRDNPYLEFVFDTDRIKKLATVEFQDPGWLASPEYVERATLGQYDLVIFDQCAPETMPLCNTVFWNAIPKDSEWTLGETQAPTFIVDFDSTHPLMFNVSFGNVLIAESHVVSGPPGTLELVESTGGPIMAIGPREGFLDLVIGFSLIEYDEDANATVNSDWPNHLGFPLFINNVLVSLAGSSRYQASTGYQPGEIIKFKTRLPTSSVTIKTPDRQAVRLKPRSDRMFVYAGADRVGVYEVIDDESKELDQLFPVNLLDPLESDLAVRDKLELGYEEVTGKIERVPATHEFWTWILLGAIVVLLLEWYIYNRRVFI